MDDDFDLDDFDFDDLDLGDDFDSEPGKPDPAQSRWAQVLAEGFSDGYIPGDFICQMQAAAKYEELFGEDCPLSDADIDTAIAEVGVLREGRIFPRSEDMGALLRAISDEIAGLLADYYCVYPSRIYQKFEKSLAEQAIYSSDAMIHALAEYIRGRFALRYGVYVRPSVYALKQSTDCRTVFRARGGEMTWQQLRQALWFYTDRAVDTGIYWCEDLIRTGTKRWMLAEHFPVDADDVRRMGDAIERELEVKPLVRSTELKALFERELPDLAGDLDALDNTALMNLMRYYQNDRFGITASAIAPLGQKVNIRDHFAALARDRDTFTLADVEAVAGENRVSIYWETVLRGAVRVSQSEFVSNRNIHFDVAATDAALEELCPGDYIPLKQLPDALLMHLPSCGYQWNKFLLYSYLYTFSVRFEVFRSGASKYGCYGAMVRRGAGLEEYDLLVERFLTDSDGWSTPVEALKLIVGEGLQERQKYKGIEAIAERAKKNKERKG